jgi:glycosyltransferase involved in cell wall biosynthesis
MKIAIVIPAYNESKTIAKVIRDVEYAGTVIVVDDASTDLTGDIALKAKALVVSHKINSGYDAAIQSGFEKAVELEMDVVITFDADGQHRSTVLAEFVHSFESSDVDLVLGARSKSARFSEFIFNIYGKIRFGTGDLLCGLKGYRLSSTYHRYGAFNTYNSIGTELALFCLRKRLFKTVVSVPIDSRLGKPRLGSVVKSNILIMRSLIFAIWADIRSL